MLASSPIQVKYPLDKRLHTFEDVANLLRHRYPGKLGNVIGRVYTTEEEFGPGGCQLETKHGRSQCMLQDKILYWGWRIIDRYGLESHAHQTIGRELGGLKTCRILFCSAHRLVVRLVW